MEKKEKLKFITCASYYGTGSSAITDLIEEFENVYSFTNEEFRFLHDMDGVEDLRYHLVENHNRHNSGHALKRYKRLVDFYAGGIYGKKYEAFFHGNWKKYSYEYIDQLTDFSYKGWWFYDLFDKGIFYFLRKRFWAVVLKNTIWRNNKEEKDLKSLKNEITYCSRPTEEKFDRLTKEYIANLFGSVCPAGKTIVVDQILPPTNIERYIKYFDDIKVVVVDRDPRDIWALENYVWKTGIIPSDVETFCKWYKYTRAHRKEEVYDENTAKLIQFENLIYHYEDTVLEIINWLGLSPEQHKNKKTSFVPEKSINNTKVWLRYNAPKENVDYIEKELSEYLYDFPEEVD